MGPAFLNVLIVAALAYGGVVGAMYVFQRALMYHPGASLPPAAETGVAGLRAVTLRTEDGLDLVSWLIPPADPGKPVIVYFQGNAGTIAGRLFKAELFRAQGFGMLLVSYRGFGGNPGAPTESGLFADARAALAFLDGEGVARSRTVLYGESLGTGVAVAAAHEAAAAGRPVGAVVLEAPYTSIADVAATHYPFVPARLLTRDRYDSAARIGAIAAPVLIFHGEADRVVPIRFGRGLFEHAVEPKTARWFPAAGHENLYESGAFAEILAFLGAALH